MLNTYKFECLILCIFIDKSIFVLYNNKNNCVKGDLYENA